MILSYAMEQVVRLMDTRWEARAKKGPVCRAHAHKTHERRFRKRWGDRPVDRLGRWEIAGWMEERRNEAADATVKHELSFLSKSFTWVLAQVEMSLAKGEDPGHELRASPCAGLMKGLKASPILPRFIRQHEEAALERTADPWTFSVVEFGNLTGLRALELFALQPHHIDFELELINLEHSKTGPGIVPLHPYAADIAATWMETFPGEWLFFPERKTRCDLVAWFRKCKLGPAVKAAGLKGITPRILRSTFASRLVQKGESLYTVQQLLRHASPVHTQWYAALMTTNLRRAVMKLK